MYTSTWVICNQPLPVFNLQSIVDWRDAGAVTRSESTRASHREHLPRVVRISTLKTVTLHYP
eukprot:5282734-Pyramimonas_sp.AAC.1